LDISHGDNIQISQVPEANRHHLRTFNALLTLGLMITLVMGILPAPILFMVALDISHGDNIQISQVPEANRHHLRTFNALLTLGL
ncbi:hypothetical protein BUE68_12720, partial [Corynebacterium diphtheriae]